MGKRPSAGGSAKIKKLRSDISIKDAPAHFARITNWHKPQDNDIH